MAKAQRRKVMILALALYWPALFIVAHIPVPQRVAQAHMSDKSLHYLMYMMLTVLLWLVIEPCSRVSWRRATPWLILAMAGVYAILDEYLQQFVRGRSADIRDFGADMLGASVGLLVLTFFSFWPAMLITLGSVIYILAVFTRANLTQVLPVAATVFHLATYGLFTWLWMGYIHQAGHRPRLYRHRLVISAALPLALLGVTKLSTIVSGKSFEIWDMVAGGAGVFGAMATAYGLKWLWRQRAPHRTPIPEAGID